MSQEGGGSPGGREGVREEAYGLAVQRTFRELGTSALENQRNEYRLLSDQRSADQSAVIAAHHRKLTAMLHAQALQMQIAQKQDRRSRTRQENLEPGIRAEYYGYPNLPKTPEGERRRDKARRQVEMKRDLEAQVLEQQIARRASAATALEQEKQHLAQAQSSLESHQLQQRLKKARDRDVLTRAWEDAERAKAVRSRIEEMHIKGINPRLEPIDALLKRSIGLPAAQISLGDCGGGEGGVGEDEEQRLDTDANPTIDEQEPTATEAAEGVDRNEPPRADSTPPVSKGLEAHSQSFDLRRIERVVAPVIQQYHARDTSHSNRVRGNLSVSMGVARGSGLRLQPSKAAKAQGDSPKASNWAFATHEAEGSNPSSTRRSHSHVLPPQVYISSKSPHHRYYSRVLASTGAYSIAK